MKSVISTGGTHNMNRKSRAHRRLGFTLAELLIVVAIIAVLVGVSIPIFTAQMDKAKIAENEYNIRTAESAVMNDIMGNEGGEALAAVYSNVYYYTYDVSSSKLSTKFVTAPKKDSNGIYEYITIKYTISSKLLLSYPHYVKGKTKLDDAIQASIGENQF
jgi:prepilin-type N-terminal cleavage/methylation domain-containing protein